MWLIKTYKGHDIYDTGTTYRRKRLYCIDPYNQPVGQYMVNRYNRATSIKGCVDIIDDMIND